MPWSMNSPPLDGTGGKRLRRSSHRRNRRLRRGAKVTVSGDAVRLDATIARPAGHSTVTTLDEMQDALMKLELPGGVPPVWILTNTGSSDDAGHGRYTHNSGDKDEWSLIWTKLDP